MKSARSKIGIAISLFRPVSIRASAEMKRESHWRFGYAEQNKKRQVMGSREMNRRNQPLRSNIEHSPVKQKTLPRHPA